MMCANAHKGEKKKWDMEEETNTPEMDHSGTYPHISDLDTSTDTVDVDSWEQTQQNALDSHGSNDGGGQTQR